MKLLKRIDLLESDEKYFKTSFQGVSYDQGTNAEKRMNKLFLEYDALCKWLNDWFGNMDNTGIILSELGRLKKENSKKK